MSTAQRVLSGMRPTGALHIGHLKGALENWISLQDRYACFFAIVDWHALTTNYENTSDIRANVRTMALEWLAAGLDPERSVIFLQSDVKEHAELHLLFSMITPLGWLERVPTYKEILQQLSERDLQTHGFLGYPVLQAADISLYRSHCVPVGEDQVSHLELTREIVRRFNRLYGETFPEPQALLTATPKLLGTDRRKMSKSFNNSIDIAEDPDVNRQKIMTMVTDPQRMRRADPGNPDVCTVYDYHKVFTDAQTREQINADCRTASIGCVDCKKKLLGNLEPVLAPIAIRKKELEGRKGLVEDVLAAGAARARAAARETMDLVRSRVFPE